MKTRLNGVGLALVSTLFVCGLTCSSVWAQKVEEKGVGSVTWEQKSSWGSDKGPSPEDKQRAIGSAKISAWKNYTATFSPAQMKLLASSGEEFQKNLDSYITDTVVVDEKVDPSSRTIAVVVRVGFNKPAIDQALASQSTNTGTALASDAHAGREGSHFMFLFMSRKASSVKQFLDKRVDIHEESIKRGKSGGRMEREGGASVSVAENAQNTSVSRTASGGSIEHKEDKTTYEVASSQDVDSAMGDVLTTAGIEFVSYDDVVSNCGGADSGTIKKEFSANDDMSRDLRSKIIAAAKRCDIRFFAVGTLDIGMQDLDGVTGNKRVSVSVRSQLWDIGQKLPKKVGSIGPVQYAGLGPDQSVAMRNALVLASKEAARGLVDQLNAKRVY